MTDRELLQLAAKAAGYHWPLVWPHPSPVDVPHDWNPLTDSGQALELAVKTGLAVSICTGYTAILDCKTREEHGDDPLAATRRAIVRAAAEIGKGMK